MTKKFQMGSTPLAGLFVITPTVHKDNRGSFMESYNHAEFVDMGILCTFVQDNIVHSSSKGVLRGLHFQIPHPQIKLVTVLAGSIYDVAVDLRPESPTYKKYFGIPLSYPRQLYIPHGFAHGYCVLEDNTVVLYKCSELYYPELEHGIRWDDPDININWPTMGQVIISEKDSNLPTLKDLAWPRMIMLPKKNQRRMKWRSTHKNR